MPSAAVVFTKTEYVAFNALFDSIRSVMGCENEHRIADPVGKVSHLFLAPEDAVAFVRRLSGFDLMELVFRRNDGGEELKETYKVSVERWLDLAGRVTQIADPLLRDEEAQIAEAVARGKRRLEELSARREDLARRLVATEQEIADARKGLEELEALSRDLQQVRERVRTAVNGGALARDVREQAPAPPKEAPCASPAASPSNGVSR